MTLEQQVDALTQETIKFQIGDLVLTAARRKAEVDVLRTQLAEKSAALEKALESPPSDQA